jgi:hypothetical protein
LSIHVCCAPLDLSLVSHSHAETLYFFMFYPKWDAPISQTQSQLWQS